MKTSTSFSLFIFIHIISINKMNAQCWTLSDPNHESIISYVPDQLASVYRVSITDDSTVYIIGSKVDTFVSNKSNEQYMSKSIDGGKSWTRVISIPQKYNQYLHYINFINRDTGWYYFWNFNHSGLYLTKNGGNTWELSLNYETMTPSYNSYGGHFYDPNRNRFWLVCNKNSDGDIGFYISDDLGKSWSFQPLNVSKDDGLDLHIHKDGRGWLSDDNGNLPDLYKRVPNTYTFIGSKFDFGKQTYRMSFKDDFGALIHGSDYSKISMTKDYGESWYKALSDTIIGYPNSYTQFTKFLGVKVLDSLETVAVGYVDTFYGSPSILIRKPILLKTYDGGLSWRSQQYVGEKNFAFTDVTSYGRDFAIATGDQSKVYIYRRPAPPICDANSSIDTLSVGKPLKWGAASGCIGGYVLRIGTSPSSGDIIDSVDIWDKTEWTPSIPLPFGKPIHVSIRPYNDGGFSSKCPSFILPTKACTILTKIDTLIKLGDFYNGIAYTKDTILVQSLKSKLGCDSIIQTSIDVLTANQELLADAPTLTVNPNPALDHIQIEVKNLNPYKSTYLLFSDAVGRKLQKLPIDGNYFSGNLNVTHYPNGVYLLKLITDKFTLATEKIVIMK